MATRQQDALVGERAKVAAEVYVYGYPLVRGLDEIESFVAGGGSLPIQAPYNEFGHARRLAGPEVKFVSPNNDTCYSSPCAMARWAAGAARP